MGFLAPAAVAVLVGCVLLGAAAASVGVARSARTRRRRQEADLARARVEVEALRAGLDRLRDEVDRNRHEAEVHRRHDREQREYVITSLAATGSVPDALVAPHRSAGRVLQDRLVATLGRQQGRSPWRTRAVEAAVRTVALGHGVRRALSPENLDRAAAESHVARRRSRRTRKAELREARRLVRAVRTHRAGSTAGRRAA